MLLYGISMLDGATGALGFGPVAEAVATEGMENRILVDGLPDLASEWSEILVILSVLSLAIGNVVAIAQSNIRRMLGYSTISRVGFIFLGLLAGTPAAMPLPCSMPWSMP
jgi:NADH-quinone oxidoreductase subunit N